MSLSEYNFCFDEWRATPTENLLEKAGESIRLEPKVMQVLVCLAEADGAVVSRNDLMDSVWPRAVVGDVLNNTIANLRKALGDARTPRRYIETIPKQGYRFVPAVQWESAVSSVPDGVASASKNEPVPGKPFLGKHPYFSPLLILLVLVIFFFYQSEQDGQEHSELAVPEGKKTLAVLPFDTFSDQNDLKFFAGGLVEEMIHQLATNPEFRVIARTSSETFNEKDRDIKEISRVLGARYIIEGSIRESEEDLRVTVQLIDASNGFHLWSRTFDHQQSDNLLDTQTVIGERVTALISSDVTGDKTYQTRKHPDSSEAYRMFLIAQSHMKYMQVEHLEKAIEYYEKAIAIAPDYGLAYAGLAAAHLLLAQYDHLSLTETVKQSSEALRMAFSVEPNLAEAYAVRGLQETYLLQYELAESDFKQAIELNPGMRFARHNYGFLLGNLSRPAEALVQFQKALETDPLSAKTNFAVGDTLAGTGQLDSAVSHYLQCIEVLPDDLSCYLGLAVVYKLVGDIEQFGHYLELAEQRSEGENFWVLTTKAWNKLMSGDRAAAIAMSAKAMQKNPKNFDLLKVLFMLNLQSSSLDQYEQNIKQLIIENPEYYNLNLLLGQISYLKSNCRLAIAQYHQADKENDVSLQDYWDFVQGTSHMLNLAYCYRQTEQFVEADQLLAEFNSYLKALPTTSFQVPGIEYNKARYSWMKGDKDGARELLQNIQQWALISIEDYDPIWKQ